MIDHLQYDASNAITAKHPATDNKKTRPATV
jgi:hypothetical protein